MDGVAWRGLPWTGTSRTIGLLFLAPATTTTPTFFNSASDTHFERKLGAAAANRNPWHGQDRAQFRRGRAAVQAGEGGRHSKPRCRGGSSICARILYCAAFRRL